MKKTKKILIALKIVFRIWMKWEYRRGRKGVVLFQSKHSFALVYRAYSICFQFLFPSLLVLLIEMKEKKNMRWQRSQSDASEKPIR